MTFYLQVKKLMLCIRHINYKKNKKLKSHLRVHRKSATDAEADGQIATDRPSYTGRELLGDDMFRNN